MRDSYGSQNIIVEYLHKDAICIHVKEVQKEAADDDNLSSRVDDHAECCFNEYTSHTIYYSADKYRVLSHLYNI